MRVTSACLFLAFALGLSARAHASDGGADAATGGTASSGSDGTDAGNGGACAGGGGAPQVCMTATPDNLGCSAAPAGSGSSRSAAGLALLGAGLLFGARRRRRATVLLASSGLAVALSAAPARADSPPPVAAAVTVAPAPPSLYTTPSDAPPPAEPKGRLRFGFGGLITTDYFRAPVDVLGVGAFVELGTSEDAGVWAPLVRLTGARASGDMTSGMSTATFTWYTLAADFCPIQASLAHRLWIRPCARVSGGVLSGAATLGGQALGEQKPWVTGGLLARLQWRAVGPLFLEAQGGAAYAFTHDALSLAPASASGTMDAVPVLSPASFEPFGSLGVGLTFP
jgi:MYXO-CTERM domain-containing protein